MKNALRKLSHKSVLCLVVSFACLAAAYPAFAIDITEPAATDFPNGISIFDVSSGTLAQGSNTISGSLSGQCISGAFGIDCNNGTAAEGDSADNLRLTVPVGLQITSYTVTTSSVAGPTGFTVVTSVAQQNPAPPPPNFLFPIGTTFLVQNGTTSNLITTPFGPNDYWISVFGQSATAVGAFSLNWAVTINLAPTVVSPAQATQNLIDLINNALSGLVLTGGQTTALNFKLTDVLASIMAGQTKQAINQLKSVIKTLQTWQKTDHLPDATANTIIVAANAIITSLQQ